MGTVKTSFGPWTAKERNDSMKKTKHSIEEGLISSPSECECFVCGRTSASATRMDYHNMNYDDHIKYLVPLCMSCHLKLHDLIKRRLPNQVSKEQLLEVQNALLNEMKHIHNE